MLYDYYEAGRWYKVDEKWLDGVNLNGLVEVYDACSGEIRCVYDDGREVYYQDIHGTWGFPTVFR